MDTALASDVAEHMSFVDVRATPNRFVTGKTSIADRSLRGMGFGTATRNLDPCSASQGMTL
jgi:hypothetical protein